LNVKGGNRIVDVTGFYQCVATDHILLKCGSSSITIKPDMIIIDSPTVKVQGGTTVDVIGGGASTEWAAKKIVEAGSAGIEMGNGPIKINGATVEITGSPVKVNS
jgi:uncharacterized protein (DUF2345 family)